MPAKIVQIPCLSDNFGALVHDPSSGATAAIDAPEGKPLLDALAERGWTLTDILITHCHADHVQGIPVLKERFPEARIVAPKKEAQRIGGVDLSVADGDVARVGTLETRVIETPGHTAGHVCYHFPDEYVLFAGDTLFSLGCGRVFETPMAVMWESLVRLASLPGETQVYCGHEYTLSNARFALTVDPDNEMLKARAAEVEALRADGKPTLPTTLALETATNPFLRAEEPEIQARLGMRGADPAKVFAELRERKNRA